MSYDELCGIDWEWQSAEGGMIKAPLAREAAGRNPTEQEKKGTKGNRVVESPGLAEGIVVRGGNSPEIKEVEGRLEGIVRAPPEGEGLCVDAGGIRV
jgi:hypothetical protein